MTAGLPADHAVRMERTRLSLDGLSVGDAFGQKFFNEHAPESAAQRAVPAGVWPYTDDTEMALAVVAVLDRSGEIDQDALAKEFADRYARNPGRGYGGGARSILESIGDGASWQYEARRAFHGAGSIGNGAAMRVAPLGAYFSGDDWNGLVDQARLSAEITHAHAEGQAGAIAVAVAAAVAAGQREVPAPRPGRYIFEAALDFTPDGPTRDGIAKASDLDPKADVRAAAAALGSGARVISSDTVPFTLWCAARCLDNFEDAMWTTVSGLGDRDTTCAIVGGIVACAVGVEGLPKAWLKSREPLK